MTNYAAVIGGTGGLGAAIVERLVRDGNSVVLGYHSAAKKAETMATRLSAGDVRVVARQIDTRDLGSVESFLTAPDDGRITSVINAVGPAIPLKPLKDVSSDVFWSIMGTDVLGGYNVLTAAMRVLGNEGGGSIVQLLTTAVLRTLENDGMSGIPKTALMGIVRQLAREVRDSGVRLNAIAPGVIDAGIVHSSFEVDETAKGVIELCMNRTPMPRMGLPGEVAALAAFLASDESSYMNGQIIAVDGGYSA